MFPQTKHLQNRYNSVIKRNPSLKKMYKRSSPKNKNSTPKFNLLFCKIKITKKKICHLTI